MLIDPFGYDLPRRALLRGIGAAILVPIAACASRETGDAARPGDATSGSTSEPLAPSVVLRAGAEGAWTITRILRVIG